MKNAIMGFALAILTIAGVQAQENKTIKEESTVKRVVTKKGSNVEVVETKDTKTESGAVVVKDDNRTNQEFKIDSKKATDKKVLVDEVNTDAQNEAMISDNKKRQEAELEASKREQEEIAAKNKMELQKKQEAKQKELAERRAALEARPKGTARLKKD